MSEKVKWLIAMDFKPSSFISNTKGLQDNAGQEFFH
jgi:hypothetical protein